MVTERDGCGVPTARDDNWAVASADDTRIDSQRAQLGETLLDLPLQGARPPAQHSGVGDADSGAVLGHHSEQGGRQLLDGPWLVAYLAKVDH